MSDTARQYFPTKENEWDAHLVFACTKQNIVSFFLEKMSWRLVLLHARRRDSFE